MSCQVPLTVTTSGYISYYFIKFVSVKLTCIPYSNGQAVYYHDSEYVDPNYHDSKYYHDNRSALLLGVTY